LFYGWLFRDASTGSFLEREAALAHNRRQAKWLPKYLLRWFAIAGLMLAAAKYCDLVLASRTMSLPFYVMTTLTVAFNTVTAACWGLLRFGG